MFSNEEAEEDVFLSKLAVIFLISNLNHWWKLWCSYISYYQTIYVPLTQVIDSTAGFQGASSTFIPRKQRRRNRKRSAEAFQLLVQQDAAYFMDHFRISKACFVAICSFIQRLGFYPPNMRYLARRREVTVAHALGMLLIFIGHGCSYKITGALCGFAKQTTRLHINRIRRIMLDAVVPACICWPSDAEIEMIKADFLERGHIPNVVGAVDGTHIPILIPPDDHVDFINRKSFHSLVFQGVAIGTTLKFINFIVDGQEAYMTQRCLRTVQFVIISNKDCTKDLFCSQMLLMLWKVGVLHLSNVRLLKMYKKQTTISGIQVPEWWWKEPLECSRSGSQFSKNHGHLTMPK